MYDGQDMEDAYWTSDPRTLDLSKALAAAQGELKRIGDKASLAASFSHPDVEVIVDQLIYNYKMEKMNAEFNRKMMLDIRRWVMNETDYLID
jgi:hypothetical protein